MGDGTKRHLHTGRSFHQHASQFLRSVPEVPLIPHVNRIPFAALDVLRDVFATDSRLYRTLHIFDRHPVTGSFQAINIDIEIETLRNTFRKYCPHTRQARQ